MPSLRTIYRVFKYKLKHPSDRSEGPYLSGLLAFKSPLLMRTVINILDIRPNDMVLEAGIGHGEGVRLAFKKIENGSGAVYVVDRVRSAFQLLEHTFSSDGIAAKKIVFNEVADLNCLPFNNEFFTKIFHVHSPYFWAEDLPEVLDEMFRVLQPGGLLLCGMHMTKLKVLEKIKLIRRRQFDPTRYLLALEPAGFEKPKVEYVDSGVGTEYQMIIARKPAVVDDRRDPEAVSRWLEGKLMFDYVLDKGIEEGESTIDVQRQIEAAKIDEKLALPDLKKETPALPAPKVEQSPKSE